MMMPSRICDLQRIFFSYVVEVEDATYAKVTDTDTLLLNERMVGKVLDLQ
jgi:hypothetical protein